MFGVGFGVGGHIHEIESGGVGGRGSNPATQNPGTFSETDKLMLK